MNDVKKAIEFANESHVGQLRKGTKVPYIFHVVNVGKILSEHGCDESEVIAGILHDTVEDTKVTLADIEERFGKEVMELVRSASEPTGRAARAARLVSSEPRSGCYPQAPSNYARQCPGLCGLA